MQNPLILNDKSFGPEFIADVALAGHAAGESAEAVAHRYGVSAEQVTAWRERLVSHAAQIFASDPPPNHAGKQLAGDDLALLQLISELSSDVIFAKDRVGRLCFANSGTLALLRKPLHDVLGRTDLEYLDSEDAALAIMENDRRIMSTGVAEEVEEIVPLPDGGRQIWLGRKVPYRNEYGEVVGIVGIARDITERVEKEEEVRCAYAMLERVINSITDGFLVLDHDWNYTYFSQTGAKMLGVRAEDMVGNCVWDVFPHADSLMFGREYRRAVETQMPTHFEEYYPDPLNIWLECHCYPCADGLSVYFRDVTARRQAEAAIVAAERRANAMLDVTPVGLAYADINGRLGMMNAECRRLWGNPPEATSVEDYENFKGWWADGSSRHGQRLSAREWPMARALAGERVLDAMVEIEPFNSPGVRTTSLLRSVPITDENGKVIGAVTAQTDITEALRTKAELEEKSRQLRQLANSIPQLAWMADATGYIHWYNDRWYEYTGTDPADMEGWGWQAVHDPAVLPAVMEEWQHSLSTGVPFEMAFPIKGKDGVFRPFYTLVEPLRDSSGAVTQWFGTNTDVSTLENAQTELRTVQHWLQESLKAGRMVAWEWHLDSQGVKYSENVGDILGNESTRARSIFDNVHTDDRLRLEHAVRDAVGTCSSLDILVRYHVAERSAVIWIHIKGHVLVDDDGAAYCIRGISIDVTEQALRQQALEEAGKRKDEFLAMLAHELRNPLSPIASAAQLLHMASDDAERVKSSAAIISRQVDHMTSLIDDLLDVSRVTRGLIVLDKHVFNIAEIVDAAVEQVRPLVEVKHHTLHVTFEVKSAFVVADRIRLCQVVVNILNNAAKYTPPGGEISLNVGGSIEDVVITVVDNGIGIEEELLPHIFGLFTQAARTPDRSQGGLGLGLALVDSLVRMHNGKVAVYSEGLGKGSRCVVTLPRVMGEVDVAQTIKDSSFSSGLTKCLAVMVVDDNPDAAQVLSDLLVLGGHEVTTAAVPSAALAKASLRQYDLFILDIGLPEMDGCELARQLRATPFGEAATLIALTGYGQNHDKELTKAAGFDFHITKPLNMKELNAILASVPQSIQIPAPAPVITQLPVSHEV